ncbi:hypothetical protein [Pseudactinotalea sp.]|uniref:hypothetical protein n=1 Tax=Pseudactinotalea sp. TaxID=1926260 RepID=UPI003B3B93C3
MSAPPTGPGSNEPDGGAHQPVDGTYRPGPGPYGTAPGGEHAGTPSEPSYSPYASTSGGAAAYPGGAPPSNVRAVGWIGVALLYALVIWQLLIPTIATMVDSTSSGNPFMGSGESVGLQNWADVMPQLMPALGFSLLAVLPVTVAAAVLGLAIGAGMTPQQGLARPIRILVGVTGALFVPLGIGLARYLASEGIRSPADAQMLVIVSVTLAALPLLTAAFATAFAAVLGGDTPGRGVAIVLAVGFTGMLALGPQLLDLPLVLTGGGPENSTMTPLYLAYQQGFVMLDWGRGSATSGVLLLLAGVLGMVAMLALLLGRMHLGVREGGAVADPVAPGGPSRPTGTAGIVGIIAAAIVLVVMLVLHAPVLLGSLSSPPDPTVSSLQVTISTWLPAALGTLIQVAVALIGAFAIGWCRPAGNASLWLLLPLAPWLFVGPGPLMLQHFTATRDLGLLDSWVGQIPSPAVVVGAVVVLALLFAGMRQRAPQSMRGVVGAGALGAAAVLLVTQAQSLLPSYVVNSSQENLTAPSVVIRLLGSQGFQFADSGGALGLLYPIPMFVVVAALGVLAQLGLRRVVMLRHE